MDELKKIKCFLLDMDGTVYLGKRLILGAAKAIERMRILNKKVLFLTNNTSKSRNDYVIKLNNMGIFVTKEDIYTAGNATIDWLETYNKGAKVFLLGTDNLKKEFIDGGIILSDAPDIVVVGFDTGLTYENLSKVCKYVREGVRLVATHPDFNCPVEGGFIPDVGSFLALIKASCGVDPEIICGKPNLPIGEGIKKLVGFEGKDIAMVGDRLMTDMQFAINNGFTSALVLSGEATEQDLANSGMTVDIVLKSIADWDK